MLLVDIGHTRIKWALSLGGELRPQGAHVYEVERIRQQLNNWFDAVPHELDVCIACVADVSVRDEVQAWFDGNWQGHVVFAEAQSQQAGVRNAYLNPRQLGVDRWLAMLAAYGKYKSAVCVIDCGTAVTLDVVNHQGEHQGGLIVPGLSMMLATVSANLGFTANRARLQHLANNTADGVYQGCLNILVAGLKQLVQGYAHDIPGLKCIVTGGDAAQLGEYLDCNCEIDSDLVLYGLKIIAETHS